MNSKEEDAAFQELFETIQGLFEGDIPVGMDPEEAHSVERYVESLMHSAQRLRPTSDGFHRVPGSARSKVLQAFRVILLRLMLHRHVDDARAAVDRLPKVLGLVFDVDLGPKAGQYTEYAARLYLAGFELETVVFTRAILEAALREKMPDAEVRDQLRKPSREPIDLEERIRAAVATGDLSSEAATLAHNVRRLGNDALHDAKAATPNAHSAIHSLRTVLRELFPRVPETAPDEGAA